MLKKLFSRLVTNKEFLQQKKDSIRTWYGSSVQSKSNIDKDVDRFLQIYMLGLCTYFDFDILEIKNIRDFQNRIDLVKSNDQKTFVVSMDHIVIPRLKGLAQSTFSNPIPVVDNIFISTHTMVIKLAIQSRDRKRLKQALLSISEAWYDAAIRHSDQVRRDLKIVN